MPIAIQNFMISVAGYINNRHRYSKEYYEYRQYLAKYDKLTLEEQRNIQNELLQDFIKYAVSHSAFYKSRYKGINIKGIRDVKDLARLPIITKEELRDNIDTIMTVPQRGALEGHTGGTTGKSLVVRYTVEDVARRMALLDHFKSRCGFENRIMRRASFNGKHIIPCNRAGKVFWRYNRACKQMIFSSFHLSPNNLIYYVEELNKFRPQAIDGFFTCMCDIAAFIERNNIPLYFKPVAIFPTSETLTPEGRNLLERVFKCKVFNQYSSSEGAPFITECPHQKLHMDLISGVFEHFENGNNEVLVTSFTTHGTPLIRYKIGDVVEFCEKDSEHCLCSLNTPLVKQITGRNLDFLYSSNGARINSGNIANLFKNLPNVVIKAQLIQDRMDEITILLVVDKLKYKQSYDELLTNEAAIKFGLGTKVIIKHVNEIPCEKSGKFRMVKNNVELRTRQKIQS